MPGIKSKWIVVSLGVKDHARWPMSAPSNLLRICRIDPQTTITGSSVNDIMYNKLNIECSSIYSDPFWKNCNIEFVRNNKNNNNMEFDECCLGDLNYITHIDSHFTYKLDRGDNISNPFFRHKNFDW